MTAMEIDIHQMVRDNIRRLVPYASARDEYSGSAAVFLDANENPYNAPLNRYPDPRQKELKKRIASLRNQETDSLFLGNGSDEGIDLLFRVLCEPGIDNVVTVDPTYGMYGVCAAINDVAVKSVLLNPDFSLNPDRVLEAIDPRTKMVFFCSPNNPTSNSLERKALLEIIRQAPCMVVADEAYIDFSAGGGLLELVPGQRNLVVLQTLSKAWGLAGIRLGMVFAHPDLIRYLSSVKYPYNVNSLTMRKALEELEDPVASENRVLQILAQRESLSQKLGGLDCITEVFPSDANFLLVRTKQPGDIYAFLVGRGIIVRDRSRVPLCEGCLRITVGTPEENGKLVEALQAFENQSKNGTHE